MPAAAKAKATTKSGKSAAQKPIKSAAAEGKTLGALP